MDDDTPSTKGPRVVVQVTDDMQFLLTQVARHLTQTKKGLHEDIWRAGVRAHLGVDPEEVDGASVASLPRNCAAARAKDPKKLAAALLKDR